MQYGTTLFKNITRLFRKRAILDHYQSSNDIGTVKAPANEGKLLQKHCATCFRHNCSPLACAGNIYCGNKMLKKFRNIFFLFLGNKMLCVPGNGEHSGQQCFRDNVSSFNVRGSLNILLVAKVGVGTAI